MISSSSILPIADHKLREDYGLLLTEYGFEYLKTDFFLIVGEPNIGEEYEIYISVVHLELETALNKLFPIFKQNRTKFKIPDSIATVRHIQDGIKGSENIGKVITLFFEIEEKAIEFANSIGIYMSIFKGPDVINISKISENIFGPFNYKKRNKQQNKADKFWEIIGLKYYPTKSLKQDVKGYVSKGLYMKKYFRLKWCIIKQGKKHMWCDEFGRYIEDRLKWQWEVHNKLKEQTNVPCPIEILIEKDDTYFIMEYIKGKSLKTLIGEHISDKTWIQVPNKKKKLIIGLLLEAIKVISILHSEGFVHRDLSPVNFIMGKNNKLYLIDFELTHQINSGTVFPPYALGTFGYMSPEQENKETPGIWEDLYALGGIMVNCFINMHPGKFVMTNINDLIPQLEFFTGNRKIAKLIAFSLSDDKNLRPTLKDSTEILEKYSLSLDLHDDNIINDFKTVEIKEVEKMLKNGYSAILEPELSNMAVVFGTYVFQEGLEIEINSAYCTFDTGFTGPLFLLTHCCPSNAKDLSDKWEKFLKENKHYFNSEGKKGNYSLYSGEAGLAFVAHWAKRQWETTDSEIIFPQSHLNYFEQYENDWSLANGISGQLLSLLLTSENHITPAMEKIDFLVQVIRKGQHKEGYWLMNEQDGKIGRHTNTNLAYGVSGVLLVLIIYSKIKGNNLTDQEIRNGLNWLQRNIPKYNQKNTTYDHDKNIGEKNFGTGAAGVALVFILAFELFGDNSYLETAEQLMLKFPEMPAWSSLNIFDGLSGIGITYLFLAKHSNKANWNQRLDWIVAVIYHTRIIIDDNNISWSINGKKRADISILGGNSGILYFLHLYLNYKLI